MAILSQFGCIKWLWWAAPLRAQILTAEFLVKLHLSWSCNHFPYLGPREQGDSFVFLLWVMGSNLPRKLMKAHWVIPKFWHRIGEFPWTTCIPNDVHFRLPRTDAGDSWTPLMKLMAMKNEPRFKDQFPRLVLGGAFQFYDPGINENAILKRWSLLSGKSLKAIHQHHISCLLYLFCPPLCWHKTAAGLNQQLTLCRLWKCAACRVPFAQEFLALYVRGCHGAFPPSIGHGTANGWGIGCLRAERYPEADRSEAALVLVAKRPAIEFSLPLQAARSTDGLVGRFNILL